MRTFSLNQNIIDEVIKISLSAGKAILDIYETNYDIKIKDDFSPLTEADVLSHQIILSSLRNLTPKIPILSEESSHISFKDRAKWREYWLVDPLDGTKEFIKKNGEFTTNIALISENRPVFGVIYAPAINQIYWGSELNGSFMKLDNKNIQRIRVNEKQGLKVNVVSSRSHKTGAEKDFLRKIGDHEEHQVGSSLKFCLVASGRADIYPRFGPTSEWDIAAGDAILKFSGGGLLDENRNSILYNKKRNIINGSFFAFGDRANIDNFYTKFLESTA